MPIMLNGMNRIMSETDWICLLSYVFSSIGQLGNICGVARRSKAPF